ncbi:hypothetical protein B0G81_3454 [Paraburkholderia sp. BL6665CI2N2]|nr:hypothetical protein B0G81_3454 [Paraburkholderia sp. BL6665CI2N2]
MRTLQGGGSLLRSKHRLGSYRFITPQSAALFDHSLSARSGGKPRRVWA